MLRPHRLGGGKTGVPIQPPAQHHPRRQARRLPRQIRKNGLGHLLREVRVALLEADVALPVVRDFIDKARQEALGEAVIRSVKPADQVIKIVHDGLVDMLGGDDVQPLRLALNPPTVILIAGLQGSGKTTLSAKIALRLPKAQRRLRGRSGGMRRGQRAITRSASFGGSAIARADRCLATPTCHR